MWSWQKNHVFKSWIENTTFLSWSHDFFQCLAPAFESPCHGGFRTGLVFTVAIAKKKGCTFEIWNLTYFPQPVGYPTTRQECEGFENLFKASWDLINHLMTLTHALLIALMHFLNKNISVMNKSVGQKYGPIWARNHCGGWAEERERVAVRERRAQDVCLRQGRTVRRHGFGKIDWAYLNKDIFWTMSAGDCYIFHAHYIRHAGYIFHPGSSILMYNRLISELAEIL